MKFKYVKYVNLPISYNYIIVYVLWPEKDETMQDTYKLITDSYIINVRIVESRRLIPDSSY